jgi:hypothetical protein
VSDVLDLADGRNVADSAEQLNVMMKARETQWFQRSPPARPPGRAPGSTPGGAPGRSENDRGRSHRLPAPCSTLRPRPA